MNTHDSSNPLFEASRLKLWGELASKDPLVNQHNTLATLRMGLFNQDTGENAWIFIHDGTVTTGLGDQSVDFCFEGDNAAFTDLAAGFPFNRLIRQHRLHVSGDLRTCVQNWMLMYSIMRLSTYLES